MPDGNTKARPKARSNKKKKEESRWRPSRVLSSAFKPVDDAEHPIYTQVCNDLSYDPAQVEWPVLPSPGEDDEFWVTLGRDLERAK